MCLTAEKMVFDFDDLVSIGVVRKLQCRDGIFITLSPHITSHNTSRDPPLKFYNVVSSPAPLKRLIGLLSNCGEFR